MSSTDEPTKKDLNESRAEALHAILSSLSPGSTIASNGGKLTTDQVRKISDKLGEILGDSSEAGEGARRNEKGELLNEEGLPIVDITEPASAADFAFKRNLGNAFDDPDLLPLWKLSNEEKARRKAERERILDLLEAEEEAQRVRDAETSRKRLEQEMEKRKQAATDDMDKLKQARELQKKLGKALIRNVVASRDQAEKEKANQDEQDRLAAAAARPLKPKKSVSFADTSPEEIKPPELHRKGKGVDWGDVAPGTLRKPGPSNGRSDRPVMRMHVVERHPSALRSSDHPSRDSDDESDPESYGSEETNDYEDAELVPEDKPSSNRRRLHSPPPDSADSEDDHLSDEDPSEWNDEDFDTAHHQREVALQYYEKRKTIGAEVASAMRAHTHGDNEWDQPEVPLEATLASGPPKSNVSRFKSERQLHPPPNASSLASHSLGTSVLPLASTASLKNAIRMGKLDGDKLVGGEEGDSDGEVTAEDENARQLLEMLLRGEVTNIGPETAHSTTVPQGQSEPAQSPTTVKQPSSPAPRAKSSKVSKFKLALQQTHTVVGQVSPGLSSTADTPTNIVERSSPKLHATNSEFPETLRYIPSGSPPSSATTSRMPSMIVESPSFRAPLTSGVRNSSQSPAFHNVILESPSLQSPPVSPFPLSASSTAVTTPVSAAPSSIPATPVVAPKATTPLRAGVVERKPPVAVSTSVPKLAESSCSSAIPEGTDRQQRVSRFKAQRS